jgi:hypothetical protein
MQGNDLVNSLIRAWRLGNSAAPDRHEQDAILNGAPFSPARQHALILSNGSCCHIFSTSTSSTHGALAVRDDAKSDDRARGEWGVDRIEDE